MVFYPLSLLWGYFPGHITGFAGKEGMNTMRDWCNLVRKGAFVPHQSSFNYEKAIKEYRGKITAFSLSNDELAPAPTVDTLLNKFKSAATFHHTIIGYDHFNWSKSPQVISNQLEQQKNKSTV